MDEDKLDSRGTVHTLDFLVSKEITAQEVLAQSGIWRSAWAQAKPRVEHSSKMIAARIRGHEKEHGTAEQKRQRWENYQNVLDRVAKEHSGWSRMGVYEEVARLCDCNEKTIRRHTKFPELP